MKKPNLAAMTPEVAKAIEEMMAEQGEMFSLEKVNLAELGRRTGLSRQKLRRMKAHNFEDTQHAAKGRKSPVTLLSGYTGLLDGLLRNGVTNSAVCLSRLKENGYTGSQTTIKRYIASHQHLVPAPRHAVASQGNRGRRYLTDWFGPLAEKLRITATGNLLYNLASLARDSGSCVLTLNLACHYDGLRFIPLAPELESGTVLVWKKAQTFSPAAAAFIAYSKEYISGIV